MKTTDVECGEFITSGKKNGHCKCEGSNGVHAKNKGVVKELISLPEPNFKPNEQALAPTFAKGVVRITKYYIIRYEDYCGEAKPEDCTNWKQFHKEARMEGSFKYEGEYLSYTAIPVSSSTTPSINKSKKSKTSSGTDIVFGRSIAVNNNPEAPGYIPYGSRVYIYNADKPDHWSNGWYIAEDTGGHFKCCPKIDVFSGEVPKALQKSDPLTADVWVFPPVQGEPS